ncbi:MAG TPA: cytochrome c [Candidatus Sulfotelmatobacter sp.]|nr:cytochrome c [Candidatus Sulfotelmatobacter sp.]
MILLGALAVVTSLCLAQEKADQKPVVKQTPIKQTSATSGKEMFTQYCAPCHGVRGKGDGPAASSMKAVPTDLTQLTKTHDGKFPANHLAAVLKFGSGPGAHGSKEMPVWGPLFQSLDKYHDTAVQQRISNLVEFIETLQVK